MIGRYTAKLGRSTANAPETMHRCCTSNRANCGQICAKEAQTSGRSSGKHQPNLDQRETHRVLLETGSTIVCKSRIVEHIPEIFSSHSYSVAEAFAGACGQVKPKRARLVNLRGVENERSEMGDH
jgi:hypothetical protein